MKARSFTRHLAGAITLMVFSINSVYSQESKPVDNAISARPALSIKVIQAVKQDMQLSINANGSISAWQEAIIGSEVSELRLKEVLVEVGEKVRKGQILAVFEDESVLTDLAQSRAALAEAEANLTEANLNAKRAKQVLGSGALSDQQIDQYLTTAKTAIAKHMSAKAQLNSQLLKHKYTRVLASDAGIISSRTATLGAVVSKGQELFKLIRQNRLEWRGEVTAAEMAQLKPGLEVSVEVPNVGIVKGSIRTLAPTLDVQNRNGLVYVDLPGASRQGFIAGMFAKGEFRLGSKPALIIPQEALSLREGFSYVFRLANQNQDKARVEQVKVQLGRRSGNMLEITSGITLADRLVASGATFLADGDIVKVIQP